MSMRTQPKGSFWTVGFKRDLHAGSGDALSKAVELAVTPSIFAFLGWRLDLWLDTSPIFLLSFFVVVAVTVVWRMLSSYDDDMRVQEQRFRRHVMDNSAEERTR